MAFEEMSKAYDTSHLVKEFSNQGLEIGEEAAKIVIKVLMPWLKKSFELSESKIDDVIAPLMNSVESYLLTVAESINKADNEVK